MTVVRRASTVRVPLARHAKRGGQHPVRTIVTFLGIATSVLLFSGVGVGVFVVWDAASTAVAGAIDLGEDEPIPPSIGAIEGGANILVVGTGSCEGNNGALSVACRNGDTAGERNDVTMLVHISEDPARVTVVSFPRDLIVPMPACPKEDGAAPSAAIGAEMLNASYAHGGLGCTVRVVEALTGEDIQFAAAVRWTGVINMSDAIGGVEVCVAGDINDPYTGLSLTAGPHTLQGWSALQFLRMRHGIGNGSDLGRISNQQQFISSMVRKLQSDAVLADPPALLQLSSALLAQVAAGEVILSESLTNPTLMVQIAMAVKDVPYEDIVLVQYPTQYADDGSGRVLPITDAADILFAALRDNVALTLTGEPSQGDGVEVTGEAAKPGASATAAPTHPAEAEGRVELPAVIAGQTAAQVTCTKPQS